MRNHFNMANIQIILILSLLTHSFTIPIEKTKSHHRLKRHYSKRENLVFFNQPVELDEEEFLQGTANYVRSDDPIYQSYNSQKPILSDVDSYKYYAQPLNELNGVNTEPSNATTNNLPSEGLSTVKPESFEFDDIIYGKLKKTIANDSSNSHPLWNNFAKYYNIQDKNSTLDSYGVTSTTSPPTFNPYLPKATDNNESFNESSKALVSVSDHESLIQSSEMSGTISDNEVNIHHQTENTVHSGTDFDIHVVNPDPQINEQLNEGNNAESSFQQTNESYTNAASASASMNAVMNFQYQALETQNQVTSDISEDNGFRYTSTMPSLSSSTPDNTLSPLLETTYKSSPPPLQSTLPPVESTLPPVQSTSPTVQTTTTQLTGELTTTISPYNQWLSNITSIYYQWLSNISSTAAPVLVETSASTINSESPKNPVAAANSQQSQKSSPTYETYPQRGLNTLNVIASGPVILNIQQPPLVLNISDVESASLSTNIINAASQENYTSPNETPYINTFNPLFGGQNSSLLGQKYTPQSEAKAIPLSSNTSLYGATMQQSIVAEVSQKDIPIDSEESKNILAGNTNLNNISFKPEQTETFNALKQQNVYLGENKKVNENGVVENTLIGLYNQRNMESFVGPANDEIIGSTTPASSNLIPKRLDEGTYQVIGQPTVAPFTPIIPKQNEVLLNYSIQASSASPTALDLGKGNLVISPKKVTVENNSNDVQQINQKPALPFYYPTIHEVNTFSTGLVDKTTSKLTTTPTPDNLETTTVPIFNPIETLTTTSSPGMVIKSNKVEVSFDRLHFPSNYPGVYRVQFKVPVENETVVQTNTHQEKPNEVFSVLDKEAAYQLMKPQNVANLYGTTTTATPKQVEVNTTIASPLLSCLRDRKIASDPNSFDMFKPDCLSNGDYKPIQCYEHKQFGKWCWCVDVKGQEIIGSKVDAHSGNLTNEKCMQLRHQNSTNKYWTTFYRPTTTTPTPLHVLDSVTSQTKIKDIGQCEKERQLSKAPMIGGDSFSPECNEDGTYKSRQCFSHLYYGKQCWCVDKYGQEILGTRRIDGSHPDCKKVTKELCTYQAKKGKCNMHITKIFYNVQTKECEFFVYSGCGGNANNFMSVAECETKCKKESLLLVEVQPEKSVSQPKLDAKKTNQIQTGKRTAFRNEKLMKISFAIIIPFNDRLNLPSHPTYIQIKSALNQTISALYPSLFTKVQIVSIEPYVIPDDSKKVQYVLVNAVLTFTDSPNDGLKLIQDTVNSGVFGGLLVIIGSFRKSPVQQAIPKVGYAHGGIDCKNETFGCCADGNSPAQGPNKEECPEEKCPCNEIDAEFCITIPFDEKLKRKNSFEYKQLNNAIHKWMALDVYIGIREYESVEIISLSERQQFRVNAVNLTEVILKIHFSGPVSDPVTPLREAIDNSSDILPTMVGSLVCDKGQFLDKKHKEKKLIGIIGGNNDNVTVIKDDRPFAMFKSPETVMEDSMMHEAGEPEPEISSEKKKLTLMIARPLRYYQMGKYFPHLDAGNPALLIPDKDGNSFFTKKIYKPFESRYNKNLIPIYNKDGKEIASVANDNELKNYQVDNHNKRQKIVHRTDSYNLDAFRSFVTVSLNFDQFEGDKIIDVSGHGNNGLISGAATIMHTNYSCGFACRLIGGDITFDGSKLIPKPGSAVTIAVWVKVNNTNTQQTIFSTVGFAHNELQYDFGLNCGKIKWSHIDETKHTVFNVETRDTYVKPDQWVHLAGTYDSAARKAQVFVNARLITTVDGSGLLSEDWGKSAKIGSKVDGHQLNGFVDEFYILTRALSEKEIGELVNACSYALPSPEYGLDYPCKECVAPSQSTLVVKPEISSSSTEVFPSVKPCSILCTNTILPTTVINSIPITSTAQVISPTSSFYTHVSPTSALSSSLTINTVMPTPISYSSTVDISVLPTTLISATFVTLSSSIKTAVPSSIYVIPTPSSSSIVSSTVATTPPPTNDQPTPIRSCREYYDRCHRRHDGIYRLAYAVPNEENETFFTYCDMNRNQGGWTLIITSQTAGDWDENNILFRGNDNPGLQSDFSILNRADAILSIVNNSFQYRLEAGDLGQFGGIWEAPAGYKVLSRYNNQTDIKLVKKFSQWNYTSSIRFRMPYIPLESSKALLTTAENPKEDWFGTLIAKDATYVPAPWLRTVAENPLSIWYWIRESKGNLSSVNSADIASNPINIFYYNVEVVNNITRIVLEWTLGSERKSQTLDVSSVTRMVNELRTTVPSPPGVSFKVYSFGDRAPLLINNLEELEVTPAVSREEFTLLEISQVKDLKGEELKTFYFNYQFVNHAEGQVDITFEEFGRPEKVTLDADDVLNWLRVFRSREKPNFILKASKKSNGAPLKINGQNTYTMLSSSVRNSITIVDISLTGKDVILEPMYFSININIQNDAGKRITLTWRDGIKEIDIDENSKAEFHHNLTSYVSTLPQYKVMMVQYGTNTSELVNNQQVIDLVPTKDGSVPINYVVTSSGSSDSTSESLREDPVCPPAIDGDYSEWGEWTVCSASCGDGIKSRTRICNSPSPENGGRSCIDQGLGLSQEFAKCITGACPGNFSTKCQIHVIIINLSDNIAQIKATQGKTEVANKEISPSRRVENVKTVTITGNGTCPQPYIYSATDSNSDVQYYINGQESYSVPWGEDYIYNVLYIVKRKGEYGGESKIYFINLRFINTVDVAITIVYNEFEYAKERVLQPGSITTVNMMVNTTIRPSFVMSAIYNQRNYFLNGNYEFNYLASDIKGEITEVRITEKDIIIPPLKQYFLNMEIINTVPANVIVMIDKEPMELIYQAVVLRRDIINSIFPPSNVVYTAHMKSNSSHALFLNKQLQLSYTPSLFDSPYRIYITTNQEIPQFKIYYLNLQFINKYEQSIATVNWVVNGKSLTEDVNPGSELFVNSAFISESAPLPSNLTGFIKGTANKVLLNGQTVLPVLASQQQSTLSITIGEGLSEAEQVVYYTIVRVINYDSNDIFVRYNFSGIEQQALVPSQNVKIISEFQVAASQPDNIIFQAFKPNGALVYMNNLEVFVAKPTKSWQVAEVIIGSLVPQRQYNININITNYHVEGNPVLIKYTINGITKTVQINPKESILMKIFEFSNQTITFSAEDIISRAAVELNAGKQRVEVTPLTEGQYEYITIGTPSNRQEYNLQVLINNFESLVAVVKYQFEGKSFNLTVGPSSQNLPIVINTRTNSSIKFTAVNEATGQPLMLNENAFVEFTPWSGIQAFKVINIGNFPSTNYLEVYIINKLPYPVVITYTTNGETNSKSIDGFGSYQLSLILTSTRPVIFTAESNGNPVSLNNEQSLLFIPSTTKILQNIVLGSSQMQTYYVSMLVSNPRSDSIEVKYQYFNKTEGTKQLASKQKVNIDYMATLSTQPSDITVYAVKAGTNLLVFLNNKSEISITPSIDKDTIFLVSGSEENELQVYHMDLLLINNGPDMFTFTYPPVLGHVYEIKPFSNFSIYENKSFEEQPDDILISVQKTGSLAPPKNFNLQYKLTRQTQAIYLNEVSPNKEFYAQYMMENPSLLSLNVIFKQAGNVVRITSFSDSKYGDAITNLDVPTSTPVTVTAVAKGVNTPVLINGHPEVILQFEPTPTVNPLPLKFELANTTKVYGITYSLSNIGGQNDIEVIFKQDGKVIKTTRLGKKTANDDAIVQNLAAPPSPIIVTATIQGSSIPVLINGNSEFIIQFSDKPPFNHIDLDFGDSLTKLQTYYVSLQFINDGPDTFIITYPPVLGQVKSIPSHSSLTINLTQLSDKQPDDISISILKQGSESTYIVNFQYKLVQEIQSVYLNKVFPTSTKSPNITEFYAEYLLLNPNRINLSIAFKQNGQLLQETSLNNTFYTGSIFTILTTPDPIYVTAISKDTSAQVLINGQFKVILQRTTNDSLNQQILKFELEGSNPDNGGSITILGDSLEGSTTVIGGSSGGSTTVIGGSSGGSTTVLGDSARGSTTVIGGSSGGSTTVIGGSSGGSTTVLGDSAGGSTTVIGGSSGGSTTVTGGSSAGSTTVLGDSAGGSTTVLGDSAGGSTTVIGGSSGGFTTVLGDSAGGSSTVIGGSSGGSTTVIGGSSGGSTTVIGGSSGGSTTVLGDSAGGSTTVIGGSSGGSTTVIGGSSGGSTTVLGDSTGGSSGGSTTVLGDSAGGSLGGSTSVLGGPTSVWGGSTLVLGDSSEGSTTVIGGSTGNSSGNSTTVLGGSSGDSASVLGGSTLVLGGSSEGSSTVLGGSSGGSKSVLRGASGGSTSVLSGLLGGSTSIFGGSSGSSISVLGGSSGGSTSTLGGSSDDSMLVLGGSSGGSMSILGGLSGSSSGGSGLNGSITFLERKNFFLSVLVNNYGTFNVIISYSVEGQELYKEINSGSENEEIYIETNSSKKIRFQAINEKTSETVLLNGNTFVEFDPVMDFSSAKPYVINIGTNKNLQNGKFNILTRSHAMPPSNLDTLLVQRPVVTSTALSKDSNNFPTMTMSTSVDQSVIGPLSVEQNKPSLASIQNLPNAPLHIRKQSDVAVIFNNTKNWNAVNRYDVYYISLQVDNRNSDRDSILKWTLPDAVTDEKIIPANSIVFHEFQIGATGIPKPVFFQARVKNTSQIQKLNGLEKLSITPSIIKSTQLVKIDSLPPTTSAPKHGPNSTSAQIYYISVHLNNKEKVNVTVKWNELNEQKTVFIPIKGELYQEFVIKSDMEPEKVAFRAYNSDTKKSLKINGKDALIVTPTTRKIVVTANIGSKAGSGKTYYLTFNISNKNKNKINLKWVENGEEKNIEIPRGGTVIYRSQFLSTSAPGLIDITGYVSGNMSQKVTVNGKLVFQLEPRENQDIIHIEIGNIKTEAVEQHTFFMSIRVENKANDAVLLVYKENGFDRERQIPANSVQYAEIVTTSESQPQEVTFKVFTKDRSRQLLLNNEKQIVIKPMMDKVTTVLEVGDPILKIYYINLHITNNAGKKVTLVWNENTNPQTQDIESGKAANLTKMIRIADDNLPQYEFQVHEFGTNKNLLINGKSSFTLMPSSDPASISYIELTPSVIEGETPTGSYVTETHLVVLFDNQMDRMIKIVPSRSSRGKYFVEPRAYLQVNITVDSQNPFEEIFFKALDQEKQYPVLLNESLSIPLKPTTNKNLVYNVTITPQALKVIPSHSYAFLEVQDDLVLGNPSFTTHGVSASQTGGLQLNGPKSWMDAQFQSNDCLIKPYLCPEGFTISLKGGFANSLNVTETRYVLDSGAHGGSPGVSMYLKGNKLHYQLTAKDKTWTVEHQVSDENKEIYVIATWRESSGLLFYFNAVLVSADSTGTQITETNENEIRPNFSIGRNIRGESYAEFSISSFTTFNTFIESSDILNVYTFLWSSYAAKGYTCKLRVNMADDREALLTPDKGKPEGFIIHPDRPLEITLIDLSTDGKTVAAVYFTASDLKTGVPLLINNNYKPIECLPVERQLEYINLVITTPAPGANPVFIWVLNEIVKGQIHSNPPLVPSTEGLTEEEGGIRFDGKTGSLSAGEFDGSCFSNPTLCVQGLTITVQVKLLDNKNISIRSLDSDNVPKYIIDSGGHRGQGFSIYVQNRQIYCEVSYNGIMWRVKSDAPYNNLTSILFTWHQDKGLTLYLDSEETAKTTDTVDFQDRNGETNNRITIGAENTGNPNTFIAMIAKKLVFFDQYVSRSEAMKIDAFYGVHSVTISADRYININFENNAGADVTLFPDKGERKKSGYSINPKMILELRLVEQGSQTNFPVIFRANNSKTGESLLLDGSITFVGTPSENPNEVFLVNITRQLSCPDSEENGVFPDPGDRYYFILCNQGIAQRKKCPTGTMFNKDKMECIKEKGDSKSSTKVSAEVKMQNFAGVPIIVTAKPANESFKKDIDMLPGIRKTWKIDESSMNEPFEFTAKTMDSKAKELLLNGQKSVEVRPQPEENYVVELTVTDPDFFYTATTYTAEGAEAGTAARIFIKLYGVIGQTNEIQLVGKDENVFSAGETDSFKIDAGNLGALQKILIRSDDTGPSANWHIDKVIINDTNGNIYRFPANVWLSSEPGKHLEMTFEVGTGAVDITGASSGAQQVNTAKLEVVNLVNHKVDLKVSTSEKPFRIKEGYESQQLIITTPSNADVNVTVVDADTGDRYYINGELTYTISLKQSGNVEKIIISDKPSAVIEKHANIALGKMLESKHILHDYERPSYHATVPTINTVIMLWLENTVQEIVELVEVRNKVNPVIIQSNTTARFGLSVESQGPLKFFGFLYGNRKEPVFLNKELELEVPLQSDFYHLVHIVVERPEPKAQNSKHENKPIPKIKAFINIINGLDQVVKVYDITGSIEPIHVQPFQNVEETFTVANSWPILLKAQSEKQDKILLNGQEKYTVTLLPDIVNFIKINITSLPTAIKNEPTPNVVKSDMNTILLNVNNTLNKPIIVIEAVNNLQPIVIPPKTVCKIGFVINGTEFIILTAVQTEPKQKTVLLNGYNNLAVQVKMEPTDFEEIDVTGDDVDVNDHQLYKPIVMSNLFSNKSKSLGDEVLKQAELSKIPPVLHSEFKNSEETHLRASPDFVRNNQINEFTSSYFHAPNTNRFLDHPNNFLDHLNNFLDHPNALKNELVLKMNNSIVAESRGNSSRPDSFHEVLSEIVTSENIDTLDGFDRTYQNKSSNQPELLNSINMSVKAEHSIENNLPYVEEVPVDLPYSENQSKLTKLMRGDAVIALNDTLNKKFNIKEKMTDTNKLDIGKKNYIDPTDISVYDIRSPLIFANVSLALIPSEQNRTLVSHKLPYQEFEYVLLGDQNSKSPIESNKPPSPGPLSPIVTNVVDSNKVGDKATSNKTDESALLTAQIQFIVINKAGENITILDSSGKWKMSFPTESEDSQPQVAMTFNKDKSLKLTARSSSGEFLYINGEMEYILSPNMQTKGLVIHREGHDWKSDLAFGAGSSKKVSFAAINVAGQDAILKEISGTNIAMVILNGAILQGGQSLFGRTDPLKYIAITRSGKPLIINNYTDVIVLDPKSDSEIVKLVIHDRDTINDWSKYVDREGNLLPPSYPGQMFVSPNMLEEDITLSEITDTGISMDIQKGDMIQFTIPSLYKRNKAYKFIGMKKLSRFKILLNGQGEFSVEPSDVSITPIISHRQGQNWNELQSSFLSTVVSSPTIPLKLVFSNRRVDGDITISEQGGNFKDLQVPKGAIMLTVNLKIPGHIQNLNLTAHSVNPMTARFMNGEQNLIVNTKSPPPLIVVHNQGDIWQDDMRMQQNIPITTSIGTAKTFKIHVRNEVDKSIKFRQTTPAEGPVVVVPKDVTAKVDYVDKDRMGILTFEAVGEENGREVNFLLNGKDALTVNEETLPVEGEFVVIHKQGQPWQSIQSEMKAKEKVNMVPINPLGSETGTENTITNTVSSLVVDKPDQAWPNKYIASNGDVKINSVNSQTADLNNSPIGVGVLTVNGGKSGVGTGVMSPNEGISTFGDIFNMIDSINNTIRVLSSSLGNEIVTAFPIAPVNTNISYNSSYASVNYTAAISLLNNAGVEAVVLVNEKEVLRLPTGTSKNLNVNIPSLVRAVSGITSLQLNNLAELVVVNETNIVITKPTGSGNNDAVSTTHYGKLNFKNKADKDVKIYELSGIGEPTVLSPNYVSTFFVKSPKTIASFKAVEQASQQEYLLNGKIVFEVKLGDDAKVEIDVIITKPDTVKKEEAINPICGQPVDTGVCISTLAQEAQNEAQVEGGKQKVSICKSYLQELLNKCSWKNTTFSRNECKEKCNGSIDSKESKVCDRIWDMKNCRLYTPRYSYSPASKCSLINFGGCLGNSNNFATPQECSDVCLNSQSEKRPPRNTYEKRMKKVINRSKLLEQLSQLY